MKWGDRVRNAIRSFLRIEPADVKSFNLKERFDFNSNAFKNMVWYRGDSDELNQFYQQIYNSTMCFWGAESTKNMEIRKLHTGFPSIIVDTLANIVVSDMNDISFEDVTKEDFWEEVLKENDLKSNIEQSIIDALVIGDGAWKISVDTELSQFPIVEWYTGENVEFKYNRGRIIGIDFYSKYVKNSTVYVLREEYRKGSIEYHLFRGETEVDLTTLEETQDLQSVTFDNSFMMCVPFKIFDSKKYKGRGKSVFDAKIDNFDSLDEAYSQWWQAMRMSRPTKYIPETLIPRNANNGDMITPNAFDNQFLKIGADMNENAKNQIDVKQPAFNSGEYVAAYCTALDLCCQGLISPSTLGIDVKKLDNAEAQREKEKATLYSRAKIIEALTPCLENLVNAIFKTWQSMTGSVLEETEIDVVFGEYANPSFEAVVETLSNPNTPMSIEAKVEEMWGDTRDDVWKEEEIKRIKEQAGIVTTEEPAVNNGFDAEGGFPDDTEGGFADDEEGKSENES